MPDAPDFVYIIFIAADRETVWNGLIDKEVTEKYWGHHNVSDWKPGSKWEHVRSDDSGVVDVRGKVLEIEPPERLVVTWSYKDAPESRVEYTLDALGPDTRLTVTHSGLAADAGERQGWPAVLSNLKTLLETGKLLSEDKWG